MHSRNFISGLEEFLYAWDAQQELHSENSVSEIGNVNIGGDPNSVEASILTRCDPRFVASIEAGIRELVMYLVNTLGCVTYSSCEGHRATDCTVFRERHVGIVPRSDEERIRIYQLFSVASPQASSSVVEVVIVNDVLDSEEMSVPCIDIVFRDRSADESKYFSAVQSVCDAFLEELSFRHTSKL